jgi:hypothetical protein
VTPEPSRVGRRARLHETHGDTSALPPWVVGLDLRDTWRHRSPPSPGGRLDATRHVAKPEPPVPDVGFGAVGLDFKSCAQRYPVYRVPTVAPSPLQVRQRTRKWGQYPFPRATLTIFVLDGFESVVQFHQRTCGGI